jgi:hypothetical protein
LDAWELPQLVRLYSLGATVRRSFTTWNIYCQTVAVLVLADPFMTRADSISLIAIAGRTNSTTLNIEAFQCVDIAAIARPVARAT